MMGMMMMMIFVLDYKMDEMAPHYAMIVVVVAVMIMMMMIENVVDKIVMFDVMNVAIVVMVMAVAVAFEMIVDDDESVVQWLRSN